ncbi:MAG: hypothetical protein GY856_50920 [bacterium]|nr:hypothetical protein [bacterium]
MHKVVTAIRGGGQGTRLWPLTRHRAKPRRDEELDRLTLDRRTIETLGFDAEPGSLLASIIVVPSKAVIPADTVI